MKTTKKKDTREKLFATLITLNTMLFIIAGIINAPTAIIWALMIIVCAVLENSGFGASLFEKETEETKEDKDGAEAAVTETVTAKPVQAAEVHAETPYETIQRVQKEFTFGSVVDEEFHGLHLMHTVK